MQDGKALQSGTSHFLGQNFAKAFDVKFTNKEGREEFVWATSWGVSTRLMGALVMAHSDDNGLVLPPRLAPVQVVIVPIYKKSEQLELIAKQVDAIVAELKGLGISVKFDDSDNKKPGWKFAEYELKGVPVRLAMGPRDMENGTVEVARRDTMEKKVVPIEGVAGYIQTLLEEIQLSIYNKALGFRNQNTFRADSWEEFNDILKNKGGFISAHWDGTTETEEKIKTETKATIRCIPLNNEPEEGTCIYSGKPSKQRVLFALSY
ncbi:MAG: His/Gly/Thr/Pro-type tRNA ligase C-terminal domain-containing protein [Mariniphaga sp.]|nr:His/Gly/Thr/Pro-type tRNA ligase C-terminal domain-containing protein [Mariniphaga sp.]